MVIGQSSKSRPRGACVGGLSMLLERTLHNQTGKGPADDTGQSSKAHGKQVGNGTSGGNGGTGGPLGDGVEETVKTLFT